APHPEYGWPVRLAALVVVTAAGCASYYEKQADEVATDVLHAGREYVLPEDRRAFEVTYRPFERTEDGAILAAGKRIEVRPGGETTDLSPNDALRIAIVANRELQDRKEALYSAALAVASGRRGWNHPLLAGPISGDYFDSRTAGGGETSEATGSAAASLTQRFVDGGILTVGTALDLAVDTLAGGTVAQSLLEANFTQPLLRGAWRGFAYEDQYRRERDFLLRLLAYERFRQTLAADIVTRYYLVLQQRDELQNEQANIERLGRSVALTRALAAGGEVSQIDLDQAVQNLLEARIRHETNVQNYENLLDRFKITLGLPLQANVELDTGALAALKERGKKEIPIEEKNAILVALASRPDVLQERAVVRDTARNVEIAADQFLPALDMELGLSAPGTPPNEWWRIRFHEQTRTAGLRLRYNIDQTENRDQYRNAQLEWARSRRDLNRFTDQVRLDVREAYRELLRADRSYELQQENVRTARRRTRLAEIEQEQGEASVRDVLEAQDALRRAQNGLTQTLISYMTTRLNFLATLGMIRVDGEGRIHEPTDPLEYEQLKQRYEYLAAG
ncbi:MAG: TolC family protein, partial [Planctomycetota bacterium]